MSRRLLQGVLVLLALVALVTGGRSLAYGLGDPGYGLAPGPVSLVLDNNLRFLSAIWLAMGVALLTLLPSLERQGPALAVLLGLMAAGGLGRLVSVAQHGLPAPNYVAIVLVELVAPLLLLWQRRLARAP
jgi:hypothetical protein